MGIFRFVYTQRDKEVSENNEWKETRIKVALY